MNEEFWFNDDILEELYPLTIIADRYGGTYSGGRFLAFNCYANEVPVEIDEGDIPCQEFWLAQHNSISPLLVGKGWTIEEAIGNLYLRMNVR